MKKLFFSTLLALMLILPSIVLAESDIFTLIDENGAVVTHYQGSCDIGDEYISGTNQHYRIVEINERTKTAKAKLLGDADMPDISWLEEMESQPVAALREKKIALYCTHSDESYIKGDGTESIEGNGGIYDIANAFGDALEELGVTVEIDEQTHLPHDAGAYRRSRQTAIKLLKGQPGAIFDIHRDGIPDPDEYATTVGNTKMSKVRLLVGRSNQNNEANVSFAKQIKAVGDKIYPGLIKDIYMGKGSYNQDLAPRSVLLEFGTHTLAKELVLNAVQPMSEVVYKAMYGGVTGSAGSSDVSSSRTAKTTEDEKPATENNTGSSWILWLVIALVVGLGIFALLSTGGKGAGDKWARSFSEMTGGLFGKKPPKND